MSDLNEDAKNFVDKMEKEMKRGFIKIIVLAILANGPSHGYQIIKNIEDNTIWKASASSIYPLLKSLSEKNFINYEEEKDGERIRKVYELTKKGEKALELVHQRHRKILTSIDSIVKMKIKSNSKMPFPFPNPKQMYSYFEKLINESNSEELYNLKTVAKHHVQNLNQLLEKINNKINNDKKQ
ncbi:MAG: PadR family transcriptional regulator [Candidatus Lokiarchaeota archaeon]|nr:PadR family transcriptional regulator [Candidatus Lokiarchaeota archaeon]